MGDLDLDTVVDDLQSLSKEDEWTPAARVMARKISNANSLDSTDNRDFNYINMPNTQVGAHN